MVIRKVIYRFLFLITMTILVCSCIQDNHPPCLSGEGDEEYPEEGGSLFSVRINTGSKSTKATDPGTEGERIVTGVRLVFYNTEGIAVYAWDLDAKNVDEDDLVYFHGSDVAHYSNTKESFVSVARNIKRDNYKLLVILNPNDEIKEITEKNNTIDRLMEPVELDYTKFFEYQYIAGTESKKFMMLNHQGLIDVDADTDFYDTKQSAEANPVPVIVERVLAKISVTGSNIKLPEGVTYQAQILWDVDLRNKKTYWLREAARKADGTEELFGDTDYENWYAKDPNFSSYSRLTEEELDKEFIYVDNYSGFFNSLGFESFALENTMSAEEQTMNVTTSIVIRLQYILPGLDWRQSHFFQYNGTSIPYTVFSTYVQDLSLIPDSLSELKTLIPQIMSITGYDLSSPEDIPNSFSLYGVDFYKGGMCFYRVPIRHFNNAQVPEPMGYGRYGLVRNNTYTINITGINGPGMAVLGKPARELNDKTELVNVEITTRPWDMKPGLDFEF
ncbi:MAG: Mfa1 family fimbria major subunit [Tannerellaceae bacterium]|nr:Mfa1 family fimbria major subunit [Tannerellaceae bacterium]